MSSYSLEFRFPATVVHKGTSNRTRREVRRAGLSIFLMFYVYIYYVWWWGVFGCVCGCVGVGVTPDKIFLIFIPWTGHMSPGLEKHKLEATRGIFSYAGEGHQRVAACCPCNARTLHLLFSRCLVGPGFADLCTASQRLYHII
jgi:hypothetical protein